MTLETLAPPAGLPVTLDDIKEHLRIDHDQEDAYLLRLASAATALVEADIRQCLIERTLRQTCHGGSQSKGIQLEAWPIKQLVSVTAIDGEGNASMLDEAEYWLDAQGHVARIVLSGIRAAFQTLQIDFVAGHGSSSVDVPANILQAIRQIIGHWYEYRGTGITGQEPGLPPGVNKLLAPSRRVKL